MRSAHRRSLLLGVSLAAFAAWCLHVAGATAGERRIELMPGAATGGHHQIMHDCAACHAPEGGVDEQRCLTCHQAELDAVHDSHPKAKFTDPRNADRLMGLDAMRCVTCHVEHQPGITGEMGVSLPGDFCIHCHRDVGKDRPSHAGLAFSGCQAAGCHNFHDNRALKTELLVKHIDDPEHLDVQRVPARRPARSLGPALAAADADAPSGVHAPQPHVQAWASSAHALAGVNCTACHAPAGAAWNARPNHVVCASCHADEVAGWQDGLHGMRTRLDLPAMTPASARLAMRSDAAHRTLDCSSCHEAHGYDTVRAAVTACLGCHEDQHTRDYLASPHHATWQAAVAAGDTAAGVSCATCHMPRIVVGGEVRVEHDQNANLRPVEAMVKTACTQCHGLGYALSAVAEPGLAHAAFQQRPRQGLVSLDWVRAMSVRKQGSKDPAHATGGVP
jgi:hypothetical protein